MRLVHVFLVALLIALLGQGFIWRHFWFTDKQFWTEHAEVLKAGDYEAVNPLFYTYPAGPLTGALVITQRWFNVPAYVALTGSMTVLNALTIGMVAVVCRFLYPKSLWWLAASGALSFNRLYASSNPPTALVIPLVVLLALWSLMLYQSASLARPRSLATWGVILGLGLVTRIDISVIVGLALGIMLWPRVGWRKVLLMFLLAAFVAGVGNPYLWASPITHVGDVIGMLRYHYSEYDESFGNLPLSQLLFISPLALIGIAMTILWILFARQYFPLPIGFALTLLLLTGGFSLIVYLSTLQAKRYFFSLALLWEVLLSLIVLSAIPHLTFSFIKSPRGQQRFRRVIGSGVAATIVVGYIAMTLHLHLVHDTSLGCELNQARSWEGWLCNDRRTFSL